MNNPPNDDGSHNNTKKPVSAQRQKILDEAMSQLKKTRGEMDPSIFGKIRNIIAKNPKVLKALGMSKLPNANKVREATKREAVKPFNKDDVEKIDQEKNLDIIAKFMTIKPSGREGIKSIIKKSQEEKSK